MKTLIVGVGALGGLIGARLHAAGARVWLATRDAESAERLRRSGLRVTGVGGDLVVETPPVASLDQYAAGDAFDLIVLGTKAQDAMDVAPRLSALLSRGGTLLPIQNGAVAQMLDERLPGGSVLGGLSNLGASMHAPGVYEQRNAGHLLIGELAGGRSERAEQIRDQLRHGVDVRTTTNIDGAVWSKLLLNCSVTTIGAVAGRTMRGYIATPEGRELFARTYDEALSVARASGAEPIRMIADPVPPEWDGQSSPGNSYDAWLGQILDGYGDVKPSMLQDFERGRPTEIDYINGYVVDVGRRVGLSTPLNARIVETVHAITRGELAPGPELLSLILCSSDDALGSTR
jgi:2-dehydropantoate 2-reductase